MSQQDAIEHLRAALEALGLTSDVDPELGKTPERFVGLLTESFEGLEHPAPTISAFPLGDGQPEPVVVAALPFKSMCVHHLLPFFGTIDVAYVPSESIIGFGSVGRVIDHYAAMPQMQERMVHQIADLLEDALKPQGIIVRCRARQLCMEMRGSKKRGVLTSYAARGVLREGRLRDELMAAFRSAETDL